MDRPRFSGDSLESHLASNKSVFDAGLDISRVEQEWSDSVLLYSKDIALLINRYRSNPNTPFGDDDKSKVTRSITFAGDAYRRASEILTLERSRGVQDPEKIAALEKEMREYRLFGRVLQEVANTIFPEIFVASKLRKQVSEVQSRLNSGLPSLFIDYEQEFGSLVKQARKEIAYLAKSTDDATNQRRAELEALIQDAEKIQNRLRTDKDAAWKESITGPGAPALFIDINSALVEGALPTSRESIARVEALLVRLNEYIRTSSLNDQQREYLQTHLENPLQKKLADLNKEFSPVKEVDPNDAWRTFALKQGWLQPGEDPALPENIRKVERGVFKWAIDYVTAELYENPRDEEKEHAGEFEFGKFPVRKGSEAVNLGSVLYNHPGPAEGEFSGKVMREIFILLENTLHGSVNWDRVVTKPNHEAIQKHIEKFMYVGGGYEGIKNLPEVEIELMDGTKILHKFGDMVFEGVGWYSNWNQEFVYLSNRELKELNEKVEADIASGAIQIPKKRDLEAIAVGMQAKTDAPLTAIAQGSSQPLPPNSVLALYVVECKRNYTEFEKVYKDEVKKQKQQDIESKRQKEFGIHPSVEIGETTTLEGEGADVTVEKHLIEMREEVAIAIGCYVMQLGEYRPKADKKRGGKLTQPDGTVRTLTSDEREQAFKAGRSSEMFAFATYDTTTQPIFDDAVTAKSSLTAGRLGMTDLYRGNYKNLGREGVFVDGIDITHQLLPAPLRFFAVDGVPLQDLFRDRDKRMNANYLSLGDSKGKKLKYSEIYGFTTQIYTAISGGIGKAVSGARLLELAKVEKPGGFLSAQQILRFNDEMLQSIIEYTDKQIGYYLDRMNVTVAERDAKGSTYDREYWTEIPGTGIASPLYKNFLNLPEADWKSVIEDIKRIGFKRAMIKPYMSQIIIESLIRSGAREITVQQAQALKFALAGKAPSLYAVNSKDESLESLIRSPLYSAAFNYTAEEVSFLIDKANLIMRSGVSVFLLRQGGLK